MKKRFATAITLDGLACLLPDPERYPAAARQANSYRCPAGAAPGEAFLLMTRAHVDELTKTEAVTLEWKVIDRSSQSPTTVTHRFGGLYFAEATRLLRGADADPNGAMLVKLRDVRQLLAMTSAGNASYNLRATGQAALFLPESRDGVSDWTWASMLADLWSKLPQDLAVETPELPYTPHGNPEGWCFAGTSAWEAIHQVLTKLSCTTIFNPTDESFAIVEVGAKQTLTIDDGEEGSEEVSLDEYPGPITFQAQPITGNAAAIPEKVRVWFPTWHDVFGSGWEQAGDEEWDRDRSAISREVATMHVDAIEGTTLDLWDDQSACYDGNSDLQNDSEVEARAEEVLEKWLQAATTSQRHQVVIGIDSAILPGSEIREVCWRNWGESLGGSVTEFHANPVHLGMHQRLLPATSILGSLFNATLTEAMGSTTSHQARFTFDDATGGAMGHDARSAWNHAQSGDKALVAWINHRWQYIDIYNCSAVTS